MGGKPRVNTAVLDTLRLLACAIDETIDEAPVSEVVVLADTRLKVWILLIVIKCKRESAHPQAFNSSHMVARLYRLYVTSGLRHKPSARSATGSILGVAAEVWSSRASSPF
jgi:hypothetical protein